MNYETRWFRFQDFTSLEHFPESMPRTEFMDCVGRNDHTAVVVTLETCPVGYMLYHFGARVIVVKSLVVAPEHRRKGAGWLLLEWAFINRGKRHRVDVWVGVAAHGFLLACGYEAFEDKGGLTRFSRYSSVPAVEYSGPN